jgi:thioesterase domain-containing protein/acyl carrier protein
VRQVVVLADSFLANEDKALAAYVVGDVDLTQLRSYLEQLLPSYCVPGYFVPMSELPLTTNRKVDKKVLPSPKLAATRREGRNLSGPVEEALAAIWKKLLGVTVTDAEANFFDLGGHSILAVRLIAMIEKELSQNLTLSDLFTHPTIGQLSALFAGKTTQANSPVIRLSHHEGAKNLFLFHPIGGSVFCYSELARLLGDKFTVYAVEAAGFSPERNVLNTELNSVEDLAEHYLGEILKVASGEVIFGGWSFGGILAYETACLFEATTGRDCGAVLILDTMVDNSMARTVATKDDAAMLKTILEDLIALDEETLRRLPRDERLRYLVGEVQASGLLPEGFNIVQMENLLQTYRSNAVAAARYVRPSRTDKDILLVRALEVSESTQAYVHDKYLGWGAFLPEEKITLRWTEGSHETMLSPGLVGGVAKHLLEYLTHE